MRFLFKVLESKIFRHFESQYFDSAILGQIIVISRDFQSILGFACIIRAHSNHDPRRLSSFDASCPSECSLMTR